MKKVIVVGGGGFAKEVIWLARDCGYIVSGILDDNINMQGQTLMDVPVVGLASDWVKYQNTEFIIAIGSPRTRKIVLDKMLTLGAPEFATLIHPSVILSDSVRFGKGCIVCAGAVFTVEISVGDHSIFNLNGTVGHESDIGSCVTVAPMVAISGNVIIGDFAEVGTGASLRQGAVMEQGSMLGMGAVLTKNIPANTIFAGNPAKPLKELPPI